VTADVSATWPAGEPQVAEILAIVAKETSVDSERLTPDATIASLDIASLDMVQAIFALETHFDVEIPVAADQENGEFATVGGLVNHVLAAIRGELKG
jgi:acyl carrier protein